MKQTNFGLTCGMTLTKTTSNSDVERQIGQHRGSGRSLTVSNNKRSGTPYRHRDRHHQCHSALITPPSDIGLTATWARASCPSVNGETPGGRATASPGTGLSLTALAVVVPMGRYNDWCERRSASDCVMWTSFSSRTTAPQTFIRVIGPYGTSTAIICHFALNLEASYNPSRVPLKLFT